MNFKTLLLAMAFVFGFALQPTVNAQKADAGDDSGSKDDADTKDDDDKDDDEPKVKDDFDNPDFSQPILKELPKNDEKAEAALKKAYEAVYMPRAKGLEKFAASVSMDVIASSPMGKMPSMTFDAKAGWTKGETLAAKFASGDDDNGDMMQQMVKQQLAQGLPTMLQIIVGPGPWEETYEDHVFVMEKTDSDQEKEDSEDKEDTVVVIRDWFEDDKGEISSAVYTIENGLIQTIHGASSILNMKFEKKGRRTLGSGLSTTFWAPNPRGGMKIKATSESKVSERKKVGDYTVISKFSSSTKYGNFGGADITFELSEIKVDDDVTNKMLKAAGLKVEEDDKDKDGDKGKDKDGNKKEEDEF